jgi:TPR repeat protein
VLSVSARRAHVSFLDERSGALLLPHGGLVTSDALKFESAKSTLEAFIRGDALIGIMPNAPEREAQMLDAFWEAAQAGEAEAWNALGEIYAASLSAIGAYEGAEPSARHPLPAEPEIQEPADTARGASLRCYAKGVRLGNASSLKYLLTVARGAYTESQRFVLKLCGEAPAAAQAEVAYERGLIHYRIGEHERAAELHHEAAAQGGHANACFELYCLHSTGEGVSRDDKLAHEWLSRAAKLGHDRALYNLGAMYATGRGVEQSFTKAVEYYERAARSGNARAALTLAEMYTAGDGVEKNEELAAKWSETAEQLGA